MLGDLGARLSKSLASRIVAEVAKDLVKIPDHEIRSHFGDVVVI